MTNKNTLQNPPRSRTITWQDPLELYQDAVGMPGIERLRAMRDGRLPQPPFIDWIGFRFDEIEDGRVVLSFTPAEHHYNMAGVVHGGVASTLADTVMGCAVQTTLPAEVSCTTLEMKINFVRPLTRDTGRIRVTGELLHRGRTVVTIDCRLLDKNNRLYCHATSTYMILAEGNRKV